MGWSLLLCLILCLLFLFFPIPSNSSSLNPLCNLDESSALLQFMNSFTLNSFASKSCVGLQSSYPKTWKNDMDCCMWDGVTCDTLLGHVIGLDLSYSWLYGELHPNSTLFQFTHLQSLNLAFNFFNGSQISFKLGGLVSITHLNLSCSAFNGEIPSEISHLSKLVSLDLSTIPENKCLSIEPYIWKSFIQNVTNLQYLDLVLVDMSSIKPNSLSLLTNLSSLVYLSLRATGLQGTLPDAIFQLPNLQYLSFSYNQNLSIQLPKSNWSSPLKLLGLDEIDLSKQLVNSIGHLKFLNVLYLKSCGIQEPNPQFFQNLVLDLCANNFSGEIPSFLSNLKHLIELNFANNSFNGQIPNFFSQLNQLEVLSLSRNNLGGPLPSSLFCLTYVEVLVCSYNKLEGIIPKNLSGFSKLFSLKLQNNLLNGTIPSWCFSLPSLKYLSFHNNQLTGHIGEFSSYSLESIDLSINNLSGALDFHMFSKFNHLSILDLSKNKIVSLVYETGVGYTTPNLPNVTGLDLSNNLFHGSIPKWLNDIGNNTLSFLDLSHNLFPKSRASVNRERIN